MSSTTIDYCPLTAIFRSSCKTSRGAACRSSACSGDRRGISSAKCLHLRALFSGVRETLEH
jgi:hypothetical protein